MFAVTTGAWRGTGPRPTMKGGLSAATLPVGAPLDSSVGETSGLDAPVARGPVPRDLSTSAENARNLETTDVCCSDRGMARGTRSHARVACEGPRPTGRGGIFSPEQGPVTATLNEL